MTQAKDISDDAILAVVDQFCTDNPKRGYAPWAFTRDIQAALPEFPEKVVLAKLRSLVKRGMLNGCACGCRGDFHRSEGS